MIRCALLVSLLTEDGAAPAPMSPGGARSQSELARRAQPIPTAAVTA